MRITKLSIENFKGYSGTWDLAPVTMIAGANFTHKTTIPLAIRLAMAGYLPPPIGSRKIFSLAGDPENAGRLAVSLEMDTGRKVLWRWTKKEDGKISTEGALSPDIAMPELLLDPKLFFAKTAAEQVQTIFSACEIGEQDFSSDTIKAWLNQDIRSEPILSEMMARIDSKPIKHIPTWIEELVGWLKSEAKMAADDQKKYSGAFAAFRVGEVQALPKDLSAELSEARVRLAELSKQRGDPGLVERCKAEKAKLATYPENLELAKGIAGLETALAKTPYTMDELDADAQEALEEATLQAGAKEKLFRTAEANAEHLKKLHSELTEADACPMCHTKRKGWKAEALGYYLTQLTTAISERDFAKAAATRWREKAAGISTWLQQSGKLEGLRQLQAERTGCVQRIIAMEEDLAQAAKPVDPAELAAAQQKVAELQQNQNQFNLWMSDRQRRSDLQEKLLASETRAEMFKVAVKVTLDAQQQIVGKAFAQVLNVAKHFTNGLLNSPLEFINGQLGRRVIQLDKSSGCEAQVGAWIPFDTFSGTEELLALAGFGVALTGSAPVKLVILDELGRLDARRKVDVVMRMISLSEAGVIDQAILIDVDPRPYQVLKDRKNFKLITQE